MDLENLFFGELLNGETSIANRRLDKLPGVNVITAGRSKGDLPVLWERSYNFYGTAQTHIDAVSIAFNRRPKTITPFERAD